MRPQDIAVLVKIIGSESKTWQAKDLAHELFISPSEISESLNRSYLAGLIDYNKKKVARQQLMEFLQHGLQYVFPQRPGTIMKGIPTAHSHPYMQKFFKSEAIYIWPDIHGSEVGMKIEPYYKRQTEAVKNDESLYLMLALSDVLRVGRTREIKVALEKLSQMILNEPSDKSLKN